MSRVGDIRFDQGPHAGVIKVTSGTKTGRFRDSPCRTGGVHYL